MKRGLRGPPVPEGPDSEGLGGSGANTVDTAVDAEEESVALPSGDQIAAAVRAEAAVLEMLFHVTTDLIEIIDDLATGREKEVIGNHSPSAVTTLCYNTVFRSEVPTG